MKKQREPLTESELRSLTSEERLDLKATPEESAIMRKINEEYRLRVKARGERLRIEGTPIVSEIAAAGWRIESVWDLVNTRLDYPELHPILFMHLMLPYSDRTREALARSMAVRHSEFVQSKWSEFVR